MRRRILLLLVAACIMCAANAQVPDLRRMDVVERSVPAGPVAIVDGEAIEGEAFLDEYRRYLRSFMYMAETPELTDEFRVQAGLTILGEMIRHEILLNEARRRGLSASDADVDEEYQAKLAYFEELLAAELGDTPTEAQVLERAGQTREEARESIREQLMVERVAEVIAEEQGAVVNTDEVRRYYEENPQLFEQPGRMHLSQILVLPKPNPQRADENAWQQAEERAERARARILAGEQFSVVARDVSEAPDAANGGDMGMLPASELPPFFVEVAAGMRPGDISGVFRSEYGVHVIRLEASESAGSVSLEEAEPIIRRMMRHIKMDEAALDFCEPIVNDLSRTRIFIQLDRTLAALEGVSPS